MALLIVIAEIGVQHNQVNVMS